MNYFDNGHISNMSSCYSDIVSSLFSKLSELLTMNPNAFFESLG